MAENVKLYKQAVQRLSMSSSRAEYNKKYMNELEDFKRRLKEKKAQLKNEGELVDYDDVLEESVDVENDVEAAKQIGLNIQAKSKSK